MVRCKRWTIGLVGLDSEMRRSRVRLNGWRTRAARGGGFDMNLYLMLASGLGTAEAQLLSGRLSAWHDAMVAHERRLRSGRTGVGICNDECPHAEARALWSAAVATFGSRAHDLTFLRSRARELARGPKAGPRARAPISQADDVDLVSRLSRATREQGPPPASCDGTHAPREL